MNFTYEKVLVQKQNIYIEYEMSSRFTFVFIIIRERNNNNDR